MRPIGSVFLREPYQLKRLLYLATNINACTAVPVFPRNRYRNPVLNHLITPQRKMATESIVSAGEGLHCTPCALVYDKPGEPLDVLELRNLPNLRECGIGEVRLRFLQVRK